MNINNERSSGLCCCFCNESIDVSNVDPCDINILTNWNGPKSKQNNQTFWCHLECFRAKMHEKVRIHLVVDLLSTDDD